MTNAISGYEEIELERAECGCCGIWEECTVGYIKRVKERHGGVWVCGLCEEAIKDQQVRLGSGGTVEAALRSHATFLHDFCGDPSSYNINIARSLIQLVKKKMLVVSSSYTSTSSSSSSSSCHVTSSSKKDV